MGKWGELLRLLLAAMMAVYFFVTLASGRSRLFVIPPLIAAYWLIIALLSASSIAKFLSEKLVRSPFQGFAGKVAKNFSRAKSLVEEGRFREAVEEYRRGLEKEPKNVLLRTEIAEVLSRHMGESRQAVAELEECLEFRPDEIQGASILNRIADIYETNLNDTQAAVGALQKVLDKWPGTRSAERAQQRMESMRKRNQTPR